MTEVLIDTLLDALKMLPFLFGAYLAIEFVEHKISEKAIARLSQFGRSGSFIGALFGVIPQCGFSVMAANLYSNRIITAGTLIAVFISTSDEAIPVLLSDPQSAGKIFPLILSKFLIALIAGTVIDISGIFKTSKADADAVIEEHSHCHAEEHGGILKSAIHHTTETFVFLIIVMLALNTAIYFIGEETLGKFLMGGSVLQPLFAGIVGLIPNCAASVVIAQLYAQNAISFGSAIAGLSAGSGMGLLLLFRTDIDKAECLKIAATLFSVSVLTGITVQFLVG